MEESGFRVVGRYAISDEIAAGGMATIHLGRLLGAGGFGRLVAIKRLHPHLAKDPDFLHALLDEARMASRIRHANVVQTLDIVNENEDLLLVMEYIHGESLAKLLAGVARAGRKPPPEIVSGILVGALYGLHAAHEAKNERGEPLGLVHRDVSPQNILVGTDGIPRVLDFGIAKAANRLQTTRDGSLKGKFAYMSPEQIQGEKLDRRADVFAAGIVLWESLAAARLFKGADPGAIMFTMLHQPVPLLPVEIASTGLNAIIQRALAREREDRFSTAFELAAAIEHEIAPATASEIAKWVESEASDLLAERERAVTHIERGSTGTGPLVPAPVAATPLVAVDVPAPPGTSARDGDERASSSTSSRQRSRQRLTLTLLGLAVIGGVGAISVVALGTNRSSPALLASAPRAESSASEAPSTVSPQPVVEVYSATAMPAPLGSLTTPSASAAHKPAGAPKSGPRPSSARPPAKALCETPYVFDSTGIRHIKPECVRP